jgi:hypothetical protein
VDGDRREEGEGEERRLETGGLAYAARRARLTASPAGSLSPLSLPSLARASFRRNGGGPPSGRAGSRCPTITRPPAEPRRGGDLTPPPSTRPQVILVRDLRPVGLADLKKHGRRGADERGAGLNGPCSGQTP